ncbi:glycoside hydrolase superfamily [Phycomyces nitens]|nr:glycoside hydrolase superfamily [Phycomyces nitens]
MPSSKKITNQTLMKFSPTHLSLSAVAAILCISSTFVQTTSALSLTIRNDVAGNSSSPILYGFMYEDINYSGDSGLYGQMLRNWNFQAGDTGGAADLSHWSVVKQNTGSATIALDTTNALNSINKNSLRLDIKSSSTSSRVGVSNEGWWGLRVQPGEVYTATFFAKATPGYTGPLTVSIESNSGTILASASVTGLTGAYQKFTATLKPSVTTTTITNKFVVSMATSDAVGKSVWFDVFSLFGKTYKNRENGVRSDIGEILEAVQPSFFRFPGGNNIEGQSIAQRWQWNETVGPLEERKGRFGDWSYWNTNGQGLLDYVYLCEDMNMVPVLGVYAGYSLDKSSVAEANLGPYIQQVLDELEYLMGSTSTTYGKLRAKHGHPEPIDIPYIEIGNEDFFSTTYDYRYKAFYDAIKKVYPDKKFISTGPQTSRPFDLLDDHFYLTSKEMIGLFNHYDNYARGGSDIFVGEFGTNSQGCCGASAANLDAALADAVFMTGLERNSDLVKMIAYAPLLNRDGQTQWNPDLVGFNTETVWGTPSYHVQVLWSTNRADTILQVDASNGGFGPLYWVVGSKDSTKQIFVKMVNTGSTAQTVSINLKGASVHSQGIARVVAGGLEDTNTASSPNTVNVKETVFSLTSANAFSYTFAPYSATVLLLHRM